jgi:hypothetical protein
VNQLRAVMTVVFVLSGIASTGRPAEALGTGILSGVSYPATIEGAGLITGTARDDVIRRSNSNDTITGRLAKRP